MFNMTERELFDFLVLNVSNQMTLSADKDPMYEYMKDLIEFVKTKGLTVKEAQLLFQICSSYLVYDTLV